MGDLFDDGSFTVQIGRTFLTRYFDFQTIIHIIHMK